MEFCLQSVLERERIEGIRCLRIGHQMLPFESLTEVE